MSDVPPGGAPPRMEMAAALREFFEGLYYGADLFKNKGDGGLEGAKVACHAAARFIAVTVQNPDLAAPFLAIRQGLVDVEKGITPDLFATYPKAKPQSRSLQRKFAQLTASAIMKALMKRGAARGDAAARVARHAAQWSSLRAQTVTATTIRNWRDKHRSDDPNSQFQLMVQGLLHSENPEADINGLLEEGPRGLPA